MFSAPAPTKVKFVESKKEREGSGAEDRSGVGLAYFNSVEVSGDGGICSIRIYDVSILRRRPQRLW